LPSTVFKSPQLEESPTQIALPGPGSGRLDRGKGPRATAQAEATRIVKEAQRQASRLVAEAKAKAKELREQSEQWAQALGEASRDRGYRLGTAQAQKEITEKLDRLARLMEGAIQARENLLQSSEREVVELAIAIAEKVIGGEMTANRDLVTDMVRRALDRASTSDTYHIRVNPADAEIVGEYLQQDLREMRFEIVTDSGIERGGCVIVTSHGQVDAQVNSQLAEVRTALLGEEGLYGE